MRAERAMRGFTFVELLVFIVVLSVGLTGIIAVISHTVSRSSDPLIRMRAVELGQAYLDEILPRKFDEKTGEGGTPACSPCTASGSFGPDGEASRDRYDDVDDFHGLDESPPLKADGSGDVRAGYNGYRVAVTVSYAGTEIGLANDDAKRIDVVVTDTQGETHTFSAYRTNFW